MNQQILKAKWNQIKGEVKEQWGELTNNEVSRIEGNRDQLIGTIQERYGMARNQAASEVANFLDRMEKKFSKN